MVVCPDKKKLLNCSDTSNVTDSQDDCQTNKFQQKLHCEIYNAGYL